MIENLNRIPKGFFEVVNDSYNFFVKTLVWNSERSLDLNKELVSQLEVSQVESHKLIQNWNTQVRRGIEIQQEFWRKGLQLYSSNLRTVSQVAMVIVPDLTKKVEPIPEPQPEVPAAIIVEAAQEVILPVAAEIIPVEEVAPVSEIFPVSESSVEASHSVEQHSDPVEEIAEVSETNPVEVSHSMSQHSDPLREASYSAEEPVNSLEVSDVPSSGNGKKRRTKKATPPKE